MTINDINPVYAISENMALYNSGTIVFSYKMDLPEIFTLSQKDFDEIIQDLSKNIYTMLPEDTVIQFQWIYQKKVYSGENLPEETFLQKATKKHFTGRNYLSQQLYIFFILPKIAAYKKSYGNFIIAKPKKELKIQWDKIQKFKELVEKATMVLDSYDNFSLKPLQENELERVLKNFFKFNNDYQTDLIKTKSGYQFGDEKISIFTLSDISGLPDNAINSTTINNQRSTDITKFYRPLSASFGLEFFQDHIVNLVIFYDNQTTWKNKLNAETKKLKSSSLFGQENVKNAFANEEFLNIIEDENRKIVRFHFSIMVFDKDQEKLKEKENYLLQHFKKIGCTPYIPTTDQIYYLLSLFPGNASELPIEETILTYDEYPFLFFIPETNYKSETTGFVFNDRLSQIPVLIDVFDKPYKEKKTDNRNFVVIAPSGGGKSFLLKSNIRQFIEDKNTIEILDKATGKTKSVDRGTKTVVINIGGDDKIAKTYKDDSLYLKYEPGQPLNVNPFYISDGILSDDKKNFLIEFIQILWKNGEGLTNDEHSSIEDLILKFYKTKLNDNKNLEISLDKSEMNIKNFFSFLTENINDLKKENKLISFDSLKLNLQKFALGTYSNLFVQGAPPPMENKKYIEFELDNIKDNPILFPIFAMLIADLTFNTIWKNDGSKKLFFIDEAWKILENAGMSALIKYLYKTIRKFRGSVGIAVQQITDIPDDITGNAILGNSGIKYLLNHSSVVASIPVLKERLGLSEKQIEQLMSIRNNTKGKYPHTEFLLIVGTHSKVLRLEVAPEAYIIYESDKDQIKQFDILYNKYQNIEQTVNEYKTKFLN